MTRKLALLAALSLALVGLAQERGPIVILSDQDFTAENGVIGGVGTAEDPFIIAGWAIKVPAGEKFGIHVENTTKPFLIRGCTVIGAQEPDGAAILLQGVHDAAVEDCLVQGSLNGIRIESSQGIAVRDNFLAVSGLGLQVLGTKAEEFHHLIEPTTSINGKPVYYYYGLSGENLADLDAGNITIAGSKDVTLVRPKIDQTDGITIAFSKGVRIVEADISRPRGNGILILASPRTQVLDSPRIANSSLAGIQVALSDFVTVRNCGVFANRVGILVNASDSFLAEDNAIAAGPVGIHVTGASREPVIRDSFFYRCSYGVDLESALGPVVERCAITDGDTGVFLEGHVLYARVSQNTMVAVSYGVSNFGSQGLIERNHIARAQIGIIFEEAYREAFPTGNLVRQNLIYRCQDGFYFGTESKDTEIYENLLWDCQRVARDMGQNRWAPYGRGNWYSNYTGTDANGDGIGDVPVEFLKNAQDPAPLISRDFLSGLPGVVGAMGEQVVVLADEAGKELKIPARVADEAHERFIGFQGIPPEWGKDLAILFVFDNLSESQFHMPNVFLNLDIVFFGADGSFLGRTTMVADSSDLYGVASPFLSALEVAEGRLSELGRAVRLVGLE